MDTGSKTHFTLDISAYMSDYDNKIGSTDVYVPAPIPRTLANYRALGQYAIYQVDSNSDEELASMVSALSR